MRLGEAVAQLRNAGVPETLYVTDGGLGAGECVGLEPFAGRWRVFAGARFIRAARPATRRSR